MPDFNKSYVVPWHNNDSVEQAWTFLGSEENKGRKSHLDALRVCQGFAKQNRILDLEAEAKVNGHTSNCRQLRHPYKGETCVPKLGEPVHIRGSSYTTK